MFVCVCEIKGPKHCWKRREIIFINSITIVIVWSHIICSTKTGDNNDGWFLIFSRYIVAAYRKLATCNITAVFCQILSQVGRIRCWYGILLWKYVSLHLKTFLEVWFYREMKNIVWKGGIALWAVSSFPTMFLKVTVRKRTLYSPISGRW